PALDPREQLGVTFLYPSQTLERIALPEGHGQGDQRLDREAVAIEVVLVRSALERLAQDRAPFGVHTCDARTQLRMAPRQRLQLHPDLGVAGIQILVLEAPGGAPLLDERRIARVHLALTG